MFKLFRKIRYDLLDNSKAGKYLKYAVGEILLVVIGILIALQINNWNEERKVQLAQEELLINLTEDLLAESEVLMNHRETMHEILLIQNQLHAFRKKELARSEIEYPHWIRRSFRNYSITMTNHPDIATQIFDANLKEQLRVYYRLLSFLENAYIQYDNVVKENIRPYLAENLALNTDFLFENQDDTDSASRLNPERFYRAIEKDEFGQILFEANLKAIETVGLLDQLLTANADLRNQIRDIVSVK